MTTFVETMEEYYALRLAQNLTKVGFNARISSHAHELKNWTVREAALCLAIDQTPLLEATLETQNEWLKKLQGQLPNL
jgi:hypothetical protein